MLEFASLDLNAEHGRQHWNRPPDVAEKLKRDLVVDKYKLDGSLTAPCQVLFQDLSGP